MMSPIEKEALQATIDIAKELKIANQLKRDEIKLKGLELLHSGRVPHSTDDWNEIFNLIK